MIALHIQHRDECVRLTALGHSPREIASQLGVSDTTVRYALYPDDKRRQILAQQRASTARGREKRKEKVERARPKTIPKEVKDAAIMAFALFEIDRETLMARITP